jgi:hypothetical protein
MSVTRLVLVQLAIIAWSPWFVEIPFPMPWFPLVPGLPVLPSLRLGLPPRDVLPPLFVLQLWTCRLAMELRGSQFGRFVVLKRPITVVC